MVQSPLPTVVVEGPRDAHEAFGARLMLRLAELSQDLRLPRSPRLRIEAAAAWSVRLGGEPLRLPSDRVDSVLPPANQRLGAEAQAERVFTAIHRRRWQLLAPFLPALARTAETALREASHLGLDLDDLRALLVLADDPAACAWAAASRCAPAIELHADLVTEERTARDAWSNARLVTRLPLREPTIVEDDGLAAGQVRLRLRRLRTPAVQADATGEQPALAIAAALKRHAAALIDAPLVAWLLLDARAGGLPEVQAFVRHAEPDLPAIATSLRQLFDQNLAFPSPGALRHALLPAQCHDADAETIQIVLPGSRLLLPRCEDDDEITRSLRAALIEPTLLQRTGGQRPALSVWYVPPNTCESVHRAPAKLRDALVAAVEPCARSQAPLLVPTNRVASLRALLQDDLPELLIVGTTEWPPSIQPIVRSVIELPAANALPESPDECR